MKGQDPASPYEIGSDDLARAPPPQRKPPKPQSTKALEAHTKQKSQAARIAGGGAVAGQDGMPSALTISVPEDEVFINPSLKLKEKTVMPLEVDSLASAANAGAFTPSNSRYGRQQTRMDLSNGEGGIELRQQSRIGQSIGGSGVARDDSVDISARPDVEQAAEGGGGGDMPQTPLTFERDHEVRFDLPQDSATPKSVSSERSDARTEISSAAVNPELSRSYHVRQLAYYAAKKYGDARLYDQHDATRIEREYREVLSKHGNSSAIRKLHRTIVSDVLDPSNTRMPTILLNGLCPLQLRGLFRLCGFKLTSNYWQKNIDDEITFYAYQILAFSILPIFPSLLSSVVSILSISWTVTQQSCMSYKNPTNVGRGNFTFNDADLTPECPVAWSQVYDVTIPAGNYHTPQGIFTNPVILSDDMSHCIGLATKISMINGYQIGLVCVYAAFISWSIFRLYLKLKQLRYMKIASHLKAVYVPRAYDLESKPWYQVLHILLQTNLPNFFPMALIAIFLYLQICLARSEGSMPCLIINDEKLADAAAAAIMAAATSARQRCFAVCESMTSSFRTEYEQVTVSLLEVVIQTGIFGATAYALIDLLGKKYFFIDAEKFMDPAWEPPYKSVHEYRSRIMTMDMVDDYEILRKEMFIDTVKKQFPKYFDPVEVEAAPTPKYARTSVLTAPPTATDGA